MVGSMFLCRPLMLDNALVPLNPTLIEIGPCKAHQLTTLQGHATAQLAIIVLLQAMKDQQIPITSHHMIDLLLMMKHHQFMTSCTVHLVTLSMTLLITVAHYLHILLTIIVDSMVMAEILIIHIMIDIDHPIITLKGMVREIPEAFNAETGAQTAWITLHPTLHHQCAPNTFGKVQQPLAIGRGHGHDLLLIGHTITHLEDQSQIQFQ